VTDLKRAIFVYFADGDMAQFTRADGVADVEGEKWALTIHPSKGMSWHPGTDAYFVDRAFIEDAIARADHWNQFD
jgi:hypothetical protein